MMAQPYRSFAGSPYQSQGGYRRFARGGMPDQLAQDAPQYPPQYSSGAIQNQQVDPGILPQGPQGDIAGDYGGYVGGAMGPSQPQSQIAGLQQIPTAQPTYGRQQMRQPGIPVGQPANQIAPQVPQGIGQLPSGASQSNQMAAQAANQNTGYGTPQQLSIAQRSNQSQEQQLQPAPYQPQNVQPGQIGQIAQQGQGNGYGAPPPSQGSYSQPSQGQQSYGSNNSGGWGGNGGNGWGHDSQQQGQSGSQSSQSQTPSSSNPAASSGQGAAYGSFANTPMGKAASGAYARGGIPHFATGGVPNLGPAGQAANIAPPVNPYQGQLPGPYAGSQNDPFNNNSPGGTFVNIGSNINQAGQSFQNNAANLAQQNEGNATAAGTSANAQINNLLNGGGGYTQDQMNNVMASQGLTDVANELPSNYLTSGEQQGIAGNPYGAYNNFLPQQQQLQQASGQYNTALDEAVTGGQTVGNQDLTNLQNQQNSAIDPSKLSVSSGYAPGIANTLARGSAAVNAAQNNPGLAPTSQYLQQAGMSDQQVNDLATSAARSVGAQFGATKDQLLQNAAAAGTTSPLAIAAAANQLDRNSAASQADAQNSARLNAQNAQRTAAQNVQNTQLNAAQYQAGLGSSNALALQNSDVAANTTAEQLRLGANSNIAGMQVGAAQNLAAQGLGQNQFITGQTTSALNNQMANEAQVGEYGATTSSGLQNAADTAASQRAGQIATNRQGINQANQNTQLGINQAQSNRAVQAYAPQQAAQATALPATLNQENYYGGQANTNTSQQLQGQSNEYNGELGAAGGREVDSNAARNTTGTTLLNTLSGALGSTIGTAAKAAGTYATSARGSMVQGDQLIEVGEHDRPEVILPLDPATPPQHQNEWEQMGAHLGDAMGIPKKGYATGGVIGLDAQNPFTQDLRSQDMATDPMDFADRGYARGGVVQPGQHPMMTPMMQHPSMQKKAPLLTGFAGTHPYQQYARGGIALPHLSMPHMRPPSSGVKLGMPIRMPRVSSPIRPSTLPHPQFARGGTFGNYQSNIGKHNNPTPLPYTEMGSFHRGM